MAEVRSGEANKTLFASPLVENNNNNDKALCIDFEVPPLYKGPRLIHAEAAQKETKRCFLEKAARKLGLVQEII